jgi:hypothetical protein
MAVGCWAMATNPQSEHASKSLDFFMSLQTPKKVFTKNNGS